MRQDRDFNNILDECLDRLFRGETVDQCLRSYPGQVKELEPLLRTAAAVKGAVTVSPDAVFRARAREEFHASLQEMADRKGFHFFSLRAWTTAVLAVVLAVVLLGSGTMAAAGNSMPGEPLYPVKLAKEQVQLTLTFSEIGKAELYSNLVDKRVNEIVYLAGKGDSEQVALTALRLDDYLTRVSVLVEETDATKSHMLTTPVPAPAPMLGVPRPATAPLETSISQATAAPTTVPAARPAPAPVPAPAITAVPAPSPQAKGATEPQPADIPKQNITAQALPVDKRSELKAAIKVKSAENVQKLRTALDTAPESARPALEQAIKETVTGYQKVLGGKKPEGTAPGITPELKEKTTGATGTDKTAGEQ